MEEDQVMPNCLCKGVFKISWCSSRSRCHPDICMLELRLFSFAICIYYPRYLSYDWLSWCYLCAIDRQRECEKYMHEYISSLNKMVDHHKELKMKDFLHSRSFFFLLKNFPGWFLKALQSFCLSGPTMWEQFWGTQTDRQGKQMAK